MFIGGVVKTFSKSDIWKLFENQGRIEQIKLITANNCAFVWFETWKQAEVAFDTYSKECNLDGFPLKILWAKTQLEKQTFEENQLSRSKRPNQE